MSKAAKVQASVQREKAKAEKRSPKWPAARAKFLSSNKVCAACGSKLRLQVHHIVPVHEDQKLELVVANFIALCAENLCHLNIGHGGSYKAYNPKVREHAAAVASKQLSRTAAGRAARAARRLNDGDQTT